MGKHEMIDEDLVILPQLAARCGILHHITCIVAESYELLGSVKCGEYQNCIAWSPDGSELFTGGKAGEIVKISETD